ncbi:hypothetical protein GCM10010149_80560 [Nonomuraea roseoviolacea subsp. roseoviolacea]|uniref:sensor histidine kinase n=1 Tax=Nonomuraea roseoviolacea TaxID=103837 RepID=UPI0031E3606E
MTYGDGSVIERIMPWALGAVVSALSMASATGSVGVASGLPWPLLAAMAAASGAVAVFAALGERVSPHADEPVSWRADGRTSRDTGAKPWHHIGRRLWHHMSGKPWRHMSGKPWRHMSGEPSRRSGAELSRHMGGRRLWPLALVGALLYAWLVMWPAAAAASYYAGTRLRGRALWLYCGGAVAVLAAGGVVSHFSGGHRMLVAGTLPNVVVMGGALLGLPLITGLWTRARRQVIDAMREQAAHLHREQGLRADQARAQERARIAREMHDVVAHRVSLMVLHAGALELRAPDEPTAEAAALIGRVGRDALTDLREVLGVLRSAGGVSCEVEVPASPEGDAASPGCTPTSREDGVASSEGVAASGPATGLRVASGDGVSGDAFVPVDGVPDSRPAFTDLVGRDQLTGGAELHPQPTLADLDRLLDESRALGVVVSRHDEGEARPLTSTVERTAYRVIQEALTNAHKHAGDTRIDVFVRYLPADLEVVVRNTAPSTSGRGRPDGGVSQERRPGAGDGLPGSGWGLVGLRERVELAGGCLVAGPHVAERVKDGSRCDEDADTRVAVSGRKGSEVGGGLCGEAGFRVLARIPAP